MFSFFKSKKPSPSSSPEPEPIPSAGDFVVIDQNQGNAGPGGLPPSSLYPNFGTGPYGPIPTAGPAASQKPQSNHPVNYLHGVPFKLSTELSTGDTNEITKIQVDDILAMITSRLSVDQSEYDFNLERSVISQG